MRSKSTLAERVAAEVEAGRGWRARELLCGHARASYDRDVYALYGRVLRGLGQEMEGGKYLLLAGAEQADDADAVELFLSRHVKASANQLVMTFPSVARWKSMEHYPALLAAELERRGYRPPKDRPRREPDSRRTCVALTLIGLTGITILAAAVYGFIEASRKLFGIG